MGRPPGSRNKATADVKATLDKLAMTGKKDRHLARLDQLTQSDDERVAVSALNVVLAYRFGRPTERVEHSGEVNYTPKKVVFELGG